MIAWNLPPVATTEANLAKIFGLLIVRTALEIRAHRFGVAGVAIRGKERDATEIPIFLKCSEKLGKRN